MSDVVIQSNIESALANSLAVNKISDLSYKIDKNYPNLSRQIKKLTPRESSSGDPAGLKFTFRLPATAILEWALIESSLTTASDNVAAANSNLGERIFEKVQLQADGNTIFEMSDSYCKVRGLAYNKYTGVNNAHGRITNFDTFDGSGAPVTQVFYTPVYMGCFEDIRSYLKLRFVQNLDLVCTVNTSANMNLAAALTGHTISLYVSMLTYQESEYQKLIGLDYVKGKALSMLTTNSAVEKFAVANGATSTTCNLRNVNLVTSISFFMKQNNTGATKAQLFRPFTAYKLVLSGTTVYEDVPYKVGIWELGKYDAYKPNEFFEEDAPQYNADHHITIYFKVDPSRLFNSGSCALKNINDAKLILTHADVGNAVTDVHVVYEYLQLVSINSDNGSISVGASQ